MTRKIKLTFLAAILIAMSVSYPAAAEVITYQWTPCDGGSPEVDFRMEVEIDGATVDSFRTGSAATEYDIAVEGGKVVSIRIAGVDAQDRQGPWSEWAEHYTADDGAPFWTGTCIPVRR